MSNIIQATKEELISLRLEQNRSIAQIAKLFNISLPLARKWLRRYNIRKYPPASAYPDKLTCSQQNVLFGSLLGDGCLEKISGYAKNSLFKKKQCEAQKEYLESCYCGLKPYALKFYRKIQKAHYSKILKRNIKETAAFEFYTIRHPIFTKLRKKWYPQGTKIVPKDLCLNPEILAWWFCDDGYSKTNRKESAFSTNSFDEDDCKFLINQLNELGVDCYLYNSNIKVRSHSQQKLFDIISPFITWAAMKYKVNK